MDLKVFLLLISSIYNSFSPFFQLSRPEELRLRAAILGEGRSVLVREHHDRSEGVGEGNGSEQEGAGQQGEGQVQAESKPARLCR
jgi:hypothetical protein